MDKLIHFINNLLDYINGVPAHQWFIVGLVVASLPITAVLVEAYKRLHWKINATELTNHGIDFVVAVTATVMTLADFVIANGTNLAHLLPFLATVMPTITAFAPHVFDYSRAIHGWFINREAESQSDRLKAILSAADKATGNTTTEASGTTHPVTVSGQTSSSLGTTSAGQTIQL